MISMPNVSRSPAASRGASRLTALVLTLAAAQAHAVDFPNVPLESGAQYPPPNVVLILDDSGSMARDYMPDSVPSVSPVNIAQWAYTRNSLSYNPATTYRAWINANGVRDTVGLTYTGARGGDDDISSTVVDLSANWQTFYVPKSTATDMSQTASYWRYDFPSGATNSTILKTEFGSRPLALTSQSNLTSGSMYTPSTMAFTVPTGTALMVVRSSGGDWGDNNAGTNNNGDGADLYVRAGGDPTTTTNSGSSTGPTNDHVIYIQNPTAGNWKAGLHARTRFINVALSVEMWKAGPTPALPNSAERSTVALEKVNYATWYTYHRTRMKVAKAGASEAFYGLPTNLRIGYTTIHGFSDFSGSTHKLSFPIPVGSNGGLFTGTNKTNFFTKLRGAQQGGTTPLRPGLAAIGDYYSSDRSDGPWGPGAVSEQLACRQNFAILTTDGYWNTGDEGSYPYPTGNIDNTAGPNGYVPAAPYADNNTSTLADIAMHYWKTDLRTLPDKVPKTTADPADWQHMVTFGISLGLNGTIDPAALPTTRAQWPNPVPPTGSSGSTDTGAKAIDDLLHASVNGRGKFIVANNAADFQRGLLDAFQVVGERGGSASNVTANSTSLTTDTRVFQATYVSGTWKGELQAFNATTAGTGSVLYNASTGIPAFGSRKVFTWNSATNVGATFPTTAQTTALDQSSRAISPVSGADNVAYIKGDSSKERSQTNGTLRTRESRLGDIVNSSPFYVADTKTLYFGANDGMLHAINADTGAELFTYVPKGISLTDLASLSDPNYLHRFFVDGPIAVSTRNQTPGANYLVGALGRGGKGVFGLDVSNPSSFSAANVRWEQSDADMGNVLGEPLIATLNNGNKVAIVGNGLNSDGGEAVLFVLNLTTGAILHEIQVGPSGQDNGLFAPRGWDNDGDLDVDMVYAADRLGNIWKFDFTGSTPTVANANNPLFRTRSNQPMTTGLALARDPNPPNKLWVFFGTGSFMTSLDPTTTHVQSVYGIIDDGAPVPHGDLRERQIVVVTDVPIVDGDTDPTNNRRRLVRAFEPVGTLDSSKKGWFIDLDDPTSGERVVTRPQVRGNVLIFASRIPPSDNACDFGGSGYVNAVDAFSGSSTSNPYFDANGDGKVDDLDTVANGNTILPIGSIGLEIGMPTMPTIIDQLLIVGGSTGNLGSIVINPQGGSPRRASWHEITGD